MRGDLKFGWIALGSLALVAVGQGGFMFSFIWPDLPS